MKLKKVGNKMKKFLKDMAERAIKTVAQTAIATIGIAATMGDVNWAVVASTSALAGVISILTSIASRPIGSDSNSASLINEYSSFKKIDAEKGNNDVTN